MQRLVLSVVLAGLLAACASNAADTSATETPGAHVVQLGQSFATSRGQIFLLRVQDEFKLIRCIAEGPIPGCYEDVLTVPASKVKWNSWMDVGTVPGLSVAFVSPTELAVLQRPTR